MSPLESLVHKTAEIVDRAQAFVDDGKFAQAVELLDPLAFHVPESADIWELLTVALLGIGEQDRAAITSQALANLRPGPTAYFLRSRALINSDPGEALGLALSAQAAAPDVWVSHAQVARCSVAVGRDPRGRGLHSARTAVSMVPDQAGAHAVLAQLHLLHTDVAAARASANRALELDPTDLDARDVLAALDQQVVAASAATVGIGERLLAVVEKGVGWVIGLLCLGTVAAAAMVTMAGQQDGIYLPLVGLYALIVVGFVIGIVMTARSLGPRWTKVGSRGVMAAVLAYGLTLSAALTMFSLGIACLTASVEVREAAMNLVVIGFSGAFVAAAGIAVRLRFVAAPATV